MTVLWSKRHPIVLVLSLIAIFAASFTAVWMIYAPKATISPSIADVAKDIRVVVNDGIKNRTLYLNATPWYCELFLCNGGSSPHPRDGLPYGQIAFFLLEDVEDPDLADNYRDMIICRSVICENETFKMVVAMFAEGGYEKVVWYKDQELFRYVWLGPVKTRHYGIRLINLSTMEAEG